MILLTCVGSLANPSTLLNLGQHDLDHIIQSLHENLDQEQDQSAIFLEDEVADAAFVVCWPKKESTPSR